MIGARLWVSLPLALYALTLSTLIAFPAGILRRIAPGSGGRPGCDGRHATGRRDPEFLVRHDAGAGLRDQSALVFRRWLCGLGQGFFAALKSLTLPAIALALPQAAILARVMRSSLLDVLGEDFMRTARAKGLSRSAGAVASRRAQRTDPGADHSRACNFPSCWRAASSSNRCSTCPASGG